MNDAQATTWDSPTGQRPAPCALVLFGATGDLARRKLLPAIWALYRHRLMPESFVLIGVGRRGWDSTTLADFWREALEEHDENHFDETLWETFASACRYVDVDLDGGAEGFALLKETLADVQADLGTGAGVLHYLALKPDYYQTVADSLAGAGLNDSRDGYARLIIEKPFGQDEATAHALNEALGKHWSEDQIYRIDHYLGKETVQNLLVLRFANSLFEPHLRAEFVDSVQITTAETLGMEGRRGYYYESAGAMRDMIQNHLLQLMALITMDAPACTRCEAVRDAKAKLMSQIRIMDVKDAAHFTARGQYDGYLQEEGVAPDSQVETFAAVRLEIENDRWRGVPFYLRTGKRLAEKACWIDVFFKPVGVAVAEEDCSCSHGNRLTIRIAPQESISLKFDAKRPGPELMLRPVTMDFFYETAFGSAGPEAYEHLLLDAMCGDAMLFLRGDEIESAWRVVDPIARAWTQDDEPPLQAYPPGSWGPPGAETIFKNPYRRWRNGP